MRDEKAINVCCCFVCLEKWSVILDLRKEFHFEKNDWILYMLDFCPTFWNTAQYTWWNCERYGSASILCRCMVCTLFWLGLCLHCKCARSVQIHSYCNLCRNLSFMQAVSSGVKINQSFNAIFPTIHINTTMKANEKPLNKFTYLKFATWWSRECCCLILLTPFSFWPSAGK